jgi:hypothetical protein
MNRKVNETHEIAAFVKQTDSANVFGYFMLIHNCLCVESLCGGGTNMSELEFLNDLWGLGIE